MRTVPPSPSVARFSLVISAMGFSRSGGAPGTPSAWETPPAAPAHHHLRIEGGFAVVDRQQRRLHDRAHTLGFPDLHGYLVGRCQQDASLTQLAGELHTTVDVIRRLIGQAGIQRCSLKVRSARARPRHRLAPHPARRPARLCRS
jgi:hypothetical protein